MFGFEIEEWMPAEGVTCPELRMTWARLRIVADGKTVTELVDEKVAHAVRPCIHVPLYPIAEWLAMYWFPLLYEPKAANKTSERDFRGRHALRFAAEGFALPDLAMMSDGEGIALEWNAKELPHYGIRFLSSGKATLSRDEFAASLRRFIETVLARMKTIEPEHKTVLHEEWEALAALGAEEREFCEAAAALGWDPFDLDDMQETALMNAAESIPKALHKDFFEAASAERLNEHLEWVRAGLDLAAGNTTECPPQWERMREIARNQFKFDAARPAWEQGYACARELRHGLGLNGEPLRPEEFDALLGYGFARTLPGTTLNFDALSVPDGEHTPGAVVVSGSGNASRRFAYARGLFEYLANPAKTALASRAFTHAQRRNRAFAAELLAPAEAIRLRFGKETPPDEAIGDTAEEWGVSEFVIRHQMENHGLKHTLGI